MDTVLMSYFESMFESMLNAELPSNGNSRPQFGEKCNVVFR